MSKRPSIRYAIITLAISLVWILIEHLMGWNTTRHDIGQFTRMLPMVLFWVMIFVTVNQSRSGKETFTLREGFREGLIMSLIYCAGFSIIVYLYQKILNPEFYDTLKNYTLEQLQKNNATKEQIDAAVKEMQMSYSGSPISFVLLFVFSSVWGVIMSAIAALVYRKK